MNTPAPVYDANGFDANGYDTDGLDAEGFDAEGRFHGWFVPSARAEAIASQFGNICERLRNLRPAGAACR